MMGAAAIALASCSHDVDLYNPDLADQMVLEKYNQAFINNFGVPAASQDWGFGGATRGVTRAAVNPWGTTCDHTWERDLNFAQTEEALVAATGAVRIDTDENRYVANWDGGRIHYRIPKGSVLYVSKDFPNTDIGETGELLLDEGFEPTVAFYNFGNITKLQANYAHGGITFYNVGTMVDTFGATEHEVYNTGTFKILNNDGYAKVTKLVNSGTLVLDGEKHDVWDNMGNKTTVSADIKTNITIYSTETGYVYLPGGGAWIGAAHIDGIVYTDGFLHIQNSNKYICGVVTTEEGKNNVDGRGDNILIDGDLTTSYIKTYNMRLDGDNIYLTKQGHITATQISFAGDGKTVETNGSDYEAIKAEANSIALVESDKFVFLNGVSTLPQHLGPNVYANSPDAVNQYDPNNPVVGGAPKCGAEWGKTSSGPKPYTFLARVFCEDLSATDGSDFDFNDVVFDVYTNGTDAEIEVLAAGGTLPLTVAGEEVHALFGVSTSVMVNTKAADYTTVGGEDNKTASKRIPVEGVSSMADLDKIEIWVEKNNGVEPVWYPLEAPQGQPAAKFAVAEQIGWVRERQDIKLVYTEFQNWVQNNNNARWYETTAADKAGDLLNNK